MVLITKLLLIFILAIVLLCEICEGGKRRGAYKKKYRNSPRISATFRTVPYKKSSNRRSFNAPQKRHDKMIAERFIFPLTWPSLPAPSYSNAFLQHDVTLPYLQPSATYPHWYSPFASFSSLRRYDLPTTPFYASSSYPWRRSDDLAFSDTSPSGISPGTQTDLSGCTDTYSNAAFTGRTDFMQNEYPQLSYKKCMTDSNLNWLNSRWNF